VAWARLLITSLVLITPTWKLLKHPHDDVYVLGFVVTLAAFLMALGVWWLLRKGRYGSWIGFLSSSFDVSFVTLALALFMWLGPPLLALNSKVTFEVYFLTLAATALRYDGRICAVAGGLAITQYASLIFFANWHWDLYAPEAGGGTYALFSMVDQITRLILLGSATLLAMLLVGRAQKLQTAASSDPLTGVGNRVHFDRRVHAELERAIRYRRPLSLALVDVDHFKKFNDVHGHLVGDDILVTVAMLLGRSLRRSDVLARYGGEEFALVLPEAAAEAALVKVDKIRQSIDATTLELPDPREPSKLTISAGIATFPEDGDTVELLLAAADERLLAAKRAGRNQVIGGAGSVVST
jgi:two-component system cell cycle response regulator